MNNTNVKKAIIFGITGQDGSYLADLLLDKGYEVTGVSRRTSTDNTERIRNFIGNERFNLVQGDITDVCSVRNILVSNGDVVVEVYNLAAQSHVGTSFSQPLLTWDVTAKGCINILQSIVDLNIVKNVRFYQASSSEMFGANFSIAGDLSKYQDENTQFLPQSPYAVAKVAAHNSVRLYREAYGLHGSCGILFNHESELRGETFVTRKITKWIGRYSKWNNDHKQCGDISFCDDFINCACGEKFSKLKLGNINSYRDWGHAKDYVEAMWLMLQQEKPDDYVICTGETYSVKDFLMDSFYFSKKLNIFPESSSYDQFIKIDKSLFRPAEVDYLRGSCKKAKVKLGWKPKISFPSLVEKMINYDVENSK